MMRTSHGLIVIYTDAEQFSGIFCILWLMRFNALIQVEKYR